MDEQQKNRLINRVHRIEGQVRGIENMFREDRNYKEIIIQLKAISSASNKITAELIKETLSKKSLSSDDRDYILRLLKKD